MSGQRELLSILEAHGKQFLQSFELPTTVSSGKRKALNKPSPLPSKRARLSEDESISAEEWNGIRIKDCDSSEDESDSEMDGDEDNADFEQEDDGFIAGSSAIPDAKAVVFSENNFKNEHVSKASKKAFMTKRAAGDDDDDRTNTENDALLHKLVHTQLLSGSLNPDLDMTPAHRRKALAGRVMELAGGAKLGKGEKAVRNAEKNKASKRVREGLAQKQREREKQELEEAKNLGNYHPTLKKLFEASSTSTSRSKSRGLNMGVGKFHGGVLRLSKQEIATVTGRSRNPGGKRGRKGT
ncbi:hypothetical protein P691DRAFT_221721 [Macrolepiota fuliginosa MF-IS2]|uniref:Uncharacterized protein n=1 Tax=Macrolepiota fuliginosa MF-IS2 TaxID=1400762 RepID=A0A9P5XL78_9AGAR|nr:hypothetical protein P691DRAFT_221721 [Macrolepiota fuliginosa MF-IS2]